MNDRLTRCLPPLAAGVMLLGLGLLFGMNQPRSAEREAAEDRHEGTLLPRKERSTRPVRASLSMPYFSFGQSLRPRG